MVLYMITLVPLTKDLRDEDTTILSSFYADDAYFDLSVRRSAARLCILMVRGPDLGYLPEPAKSLFIFDKPEEKELER